MKHILTLPLLALCATSPIIKAEVGTSTVSAETAEAAVNADFYLEAYALYYTASTLDLLAEAVDMGLANDATVLSQSNVIILENIPADIFNNLPHEYQAYLQSVLPYEQAAAAQIASLAEGDTDGLKRISEALLAQKESLVAKYPTAAPMLNNMETLTGTVFEQLKLDEYQADYAEKNKEALESDPKAMSAMLRNMMNIVIEAVYKMQSSF